MQVGDLIRWKPSKVTGIEQVGLLVRLISEYDRERFWLTQWTDGTLDTIRERMLEVVNESR
jgi:hypothetical protein